VSVLRWVPPVVLAIVLAASAGAKLVAPARTRSSFETLGLPAAQALAILVPVTELTTAVALVAVPRIGAALALALLTAFSAFLSRQITRGSTAPCACFGQVRRRPIARADLVRNGVLLSLAALTLAFPPS
jgi:uncharacterized membrane protein YphA (DoxX/SURF4 family)